MKTTYTTKIAALGFALVAGFAAPNNAKAQDNAGLHLPAKQAIPFKAFPMVDPQTNKPLKPEQIISFADGKKVRADVYFQELNKMEQSLNAKGYSLRNTQDLMPAMDAAPAQQAVAIDNPSAPVERYAASNGSNGRTRAGGGTKRITWSRDFNWEAGNRSNAAVYAKGALSGQGVLRGPASPAADQTGVFLSGNAEFGGYLLNHQVRVARIDAALNAPLYGNKEVRLTANVIGYDIANIRRVNPSISLSSGVSRTAGATVADMRVQLGPVPVRVQVGVNVTGGVNFGLTLASQNASATGTVTPFVSTSAWARAGVDLYLAGAGVGGQLTLLTENVPLRTQAALQQASNGAMGVSYNVNASESSTFLNGRIYVYAYINYLFGRREWTWDLFNWHGISRSRGLFANSNTLWFPAF